MTAATRGGSLAADFADFEFTPMTTLINRRLLIASAGLFSISSAACAQTPRGPALTVYKTPTCGCCDGWATHMREAGFTVTIHNVPDTRPVRVSRGLPDALASCHTGLAGGYLIEGHVPAADVRRLLAQKPAAIGLAVPGMPTGSPGMETPQNDRDPYDTLLVLRNGASRVFARHNQSR